MEEKIKQLESDKKELQKSNRELEKENKQLADANETLLTELESAKKEVHMYYDSSDDLSDIDKGMIEFHKKIETIKKSGNHTHLKYHYATLDDILESVNPLLAEQGLYIMQFPITVDDSTLAIRTSLRSQNGQYVTMDSVTFKYRQDIQTLGSYITYLKRYMLSGILAISFNEDTDCAETKIEKVETRPTETTRPRRRI